LPAAELDLARRGAVALVDVGDAAEMHLDARPTARLRVPRGELRGADEDRPRQRVEVLRIADDDVASRDATRGVEPEVLGRRDDEREIVVLRVAAADEDLVAVDEHGPIRTPLARHRAVSRSRAAG